LSRNRLRRGLSSAPAPRREGHWAFSTIYRFQGTGDGELPTSPLARDDSSGALYGTTFGDRTPPNGNVFRLAPPAEGGADGTLIDASTPLVVANGLVFGITRDGGSSAACGSHQAASGLACSQKMTQNQKVSANS
jgi:hypothetical protein